MIDNNNPSDASKENKKHKLFRRSYNQHREYHGFQGVQSEIDVQRYMLSSDWMSIIETGNVLLLMELTQVFS
jgi:hypothetical protein